jgi:hypothetical protein
VRALTIDFARFTLKERRCVPQIQNVPKAKMPKYSKKAFFNFIFLSINY